MANNQHAILSFQVTVLSSFLALKYQRDDIVSLFQSRPETMWVALVSLLCYCISYQFEPRFGQVGRGGMGLFGSILSISLASLLFNDRVSFVVYSLWALVSNCEIMWPVIQVLWIWVYQTVGGWFSSFFAVIQVLWIWIYQTVGEWFSSFFENTREMVGV